MSLLQSTATAAEIDGLKKELAGRLMEIRVQELIVTHLENELRVLRLELAVAESELEKRG